MKHLLQACIALGLCFVLCLWLLSFLFHPHLYLVASADWLLTLFKLLILAELMIGFGIYFAVKLNHWINERFK